MEKLSEKIEAQIAANSASRDPLDIVKLLIMHGANVNVQIGGFYDVKETPLIAACKFGDEPSVVEVLLKSGANVEAKDAFGESALNFAVSTEHPNVLRILLDHGANVNFQAIPGRETALDMAEDNARDTKDPRPAQIIKMLKAAGAVHGKSR